ncbi:MAG TPA: serine hydrolase [Pseudosphingobacterium sp.]|nr:serine hydrolase [Pseudosphingobacterium sp.]
MIPQIEYTKSPFIPRFIGTITWLILLMQVNSAKSQTPLDTALKLNDNPAIFSLVVSVNGSVVCARYFNGKTGDDLFNNQSLTKNVMAVLIGIAIDKGFIGSLDTPIAEFLPELKGDTDSRKWNIKVCDVMNQASGLWHENLERLNTYLHLDDPSGHVLKQPLLSEPGSELHYNNAASHLLSLVLSKATGQSAFDFARRYLFEPLDIQQVEWPKMKDGHYDGSGLLSIRMRTVDMNKIGRLLLNGGRYNETQIVSQRWVQALFEPVNTYPAPWGLPDTRYGLSFYHRNFKGQSLVYGMGWGGQFLILVPGKNAVIAVNQRVNDRTAIQQSEIFMGEIFPLILDQIN